jgi:glycerophosphoryl diester phosphodiesterase
MRPTKTILTLATLGMATFVATFATADGFGRELAVSDHSLESWLESLFAKKSHSPRVQLGPRPYYLVEDMDEGELKDTLKSCSNRVASTSDFSIAHRGAALQFPEHTKESYQAAGRMGAGIVECDVTFTKDRELVCRHAQCDLHTTTNILAVPQLAAKCRKPFTPADVAKGTPATAECCTSDLMLAEFKTLCGKMDASNPNATTVEQYLDGTPGYRTDLYASCGTLLTHRESIALIDAMGLKFTPELKAPSVPMPFEGDYTQAQFAQQMIDDYKQARISPKRVFPQSFDLNDVVYWIESEPRFGKQAVYLDSRVDTLDGYNEAVASLQGLYDRGVRIVAPPMFALVKLDANKQIVPSEYARAAHAASLDLITWTFERSGFLNTGGGYYYQYVSPVIDNDGDMYSVLDVLAMQVGIRGIFSDWPASVTYYANCVGL